MNRLVPMPDAWMRRDELAHRLEYAVRLDTRRFAVTSRRQVDWPAALLVAGVFAAYAVTHSSVPTGDSLIDTLAVGRGQLTDLLVPHRPLIRPLAWVFFQGWLALGWQDGALLPLQVFSALGGAAAVGLVYAIGRRLGAASWPALLAALGFAVSAAAWSFATDAEPVMTPLALALAPIWGLLAAGQAPSRRAVALLGLAVGLAILVYIA
jgi:hypothetical protein